MTKDSEWLGRTLNPYAAGLGTALGLIAAAYVNLFLIDHLHLLPRLILMCAGPVVGVFVCLLIATPFVAERDDTASIRL